MSRPPVPYFGGPRWAAAVTFPHHLFRFFSCCCELSSNFRPRFIAPCTRTMRAVLRYLTRIIPVLSLLAVSIVIYVSFIVEPHGKSRRGRRYGETTACQLLLSAYTVFLHLLSVMFPARVCWAMGDVTKKMRDTAGLTKWPKRRKTQTIKVGVDSVTYSTPTFVIILPAYKEEMETMTETLQVLASHCQARHSYHVCSHRSSKLHGTRAQDPRPLLIWT